MTSQSRKNRRITARRIRLPQTLCSLAATALFAVPLAAQQPVVYGGGVRAKAPQTAGNGIPLTNNSYPVGAIQQQPIQRQAATFGTPYPTRPAPGPVRTTFDQSMPQPAPQQAAAAPAYQPRPGGAAAPGAAGKVMYFHKAEGATSVDAAPDNSTVAMASATDPVAVPSVGVPDVSAVPPGVPQPVVIPNTVTEKPIAPPAFEVVPSQPFIPVVPGTAPPAFPEATRAVVQPEEKKEEVKPEPKKIVFPPGLTDLPPREDIFTIFDDATLERIIYRSIGKSLKKGPDDMQKQSPFPALKPVVPAGTPYVAKNTNLPPNRLVYEPSFVIHNRLLFEEKNSERYGWDFGLATPFISTASFYKNVLLWPHNAASGLVTGRMDTSAGKCLPGSPTPYYLYPQGLTITGTVAEGVVVTGLAFIIP